MNEQLYVFTEIVDGHVRTYQIPTKEMLDVMTQTAEQESLLYFACEATQW